MQVIVEVLADGRDRLHSHLGERRHKGEVHLVRVGGQG